MGKFTKFTSVYGLFSPETSEEKQEESVDKEDPVKEDTTKVEPVEEAAETEQEKTPKVFF